MNFSIEQLTTFVAVFEMKSFSKAATKLGKHRTTTSQVIGNLEDDLAVPLFERVGRSVEATDAGNMLYHYAKLVVEQADALNKVAMSLSTGRLEEINFAYASFIPNNILVAIRDRLAEQFPLLKVNFLIRSKLEIKEAMSTNQIHMALVNVDSRQTIHSIDSILLRNLTFSLYASKYSELADAPSDILYAKLKTSKQLVLKSLIDDEMAKKIILSADYEIVDSLALLIKLVKEGIGWAVLPRKVFIDANLDGVQELKCDEMQEKFVVPVAVWTAYTDEIKEIKEVVIEAMNDYIGANS